MPYRKVPLVEGEIYHIFSRSIAGFKIFNSDNEFQRILDEMNFYAVDNPPHKFSLNRRDNFKNYFTGEYESSNKIVKIIAYCLMPTHIHLILQQLQDSGISRFINLVLKSYSKYFNIKHNRKGPLWEGRFKNILVKTEAQLLHLTRYIHLNPASALLVDRPEDWKFSSYGEYITLNQLDRKICNFSEYIDMGVSLYKKFVDDRIGYQRDLEKIKHLILE